MFPLYDPEIFDLCSDDDFSTDELINYFDDTDELYELVQHSPLAKGYLWIAGHGNSESFGGVIFDGNIRLYEFPLYDSDIINFIEDSGVWYGQELIFLVCHAGTGSNPPASRIARTLGAKAYAPLEDVRFKENGFFYVSDEHIDWGNPRLNRDYQATKWTYFDYRR